MNLESDMTLIADLIFSVLEPQIGQQSCDHGYDLELLKMKTDNGVILLSMLSKVFLSADVGNGKQCGFVLKTRPLLDMSFN